MWRGSSGFGGGPSAGNNLDRRKNRLAKVGELEETDNCSGNGNGNGDGWKVREVKVKIVRGGEGRFLREMKIVR